MVCLEVWRERGVEDKGGRERRGKERGEEWLSLVWMF
jgi:hypothetical protein